MGLKRYGHLKDSNRSSTREPADILSKLLQQQAKPGSRIEHVNSNPFNYHYFMALFSNVEETNIEYPRGRLTRLTKYIVVELNDMKYCIKLPYD